MSKITKRLAKLGLTLPEPPKPVAAYVPCVRAGRFIFVSGQIPSVNMQPNMVGPVPSKVSPEMAQRCAGQCVLNALAVLEAELGDLDLIKRIVRVGVFVQSDPGFVNQPQVGNGASELLVEIFGERGRHARAAVGSVALPLGACVEVEMTVQVRRGA